MLNTTKQAQTAIQTAAPYAAEILETVAEIFEIPIADLTGPCRKDHLVIARYFAMEFMYRKFKNQRVPAEMLNRHRSAVSHGLIEFRSMLTAYPELQAKEAELSERLFCFAPPTRTQEYKRKKDRVANLAKASHRAEAAKRTA